MNDALPSLAEIYRDDFLIGCAFSARDLKDARLDLIRREFNVVTMENAMKPEALQPAGGKFVFGEASTLAEAAAGAGLLLHGHTLAWHQQSPAWLNLDAAGNPLPRAEAERNLNAYIGGVAGHFAGRVISWDVVNEAIMDNPPNPEDWRASLRQSDWFRAFANGAAVGADYIEAAFLAARAADPGAKLYYNDYNLDDTAKAMATAGMVAEINKGYIARGNDRLLIEGIGMQGHYTMATRPEDVEASLQRFLALGVEVSVTELDICVDDAADGLTPLQEKLQARLFARLFLVYKKYAASIARVTFWGLDDGSSWRAPKRPLLFRADLSPKEAFWAVADPEGYLGLSGDTTETPGQTGAAPDVGANNGSAPGAGSVPDAARGGNPPWDVDKK